MTNLEKYNQVFISNLRVTEDQLPGLSYQAIPSWDSVGHMGLVATLEETFGIMVQGEDILNFTTYENGKQMLNIYKIDI